MMMEFDLQKFKNACYGLAKTSMWKRGPVDNANIQALADKLEQKAIHYTEDVSQLGGDPNLVTRAIHYLEQIQGYPQQDNTDWFDFQLQVLIELSCPNGAIRDEALLFMNDIRSGLASYEED